MSSPLRRLLDAIRDWNHRRLEQRRWSGRVLASLSENDTAILQALVHIVETQRTDGARLEETTAAVQQRLDELERAMAGLARRLDALAPARPERSAAETPPAPAVRAARG
jgi:hypothetical protein